MTSAARQARAAAIQTCHAGLAEPKACDGHPLSGQQHLALIEPFAGELRLFAVSKAVGNVRNDGPELIEPISAA